MKSQVSQKVGSKIMPINRTFSVAPMLDWTDKHYRYFARLMSSQTLLYTEMVTTGAILHGRGDYLAYNEEEHPLALQLGGSNPQDLAACAKLAGERGYDEINLNVGCPSDRVQNGRFGACLMAEPELVAECVSAMKQVVDIPVTVKTRIGIDEQDSYEFLTQLIDTVKAAGCEEFIIHARKAWLQGLSPKENREIPPLDYERVYQLKRDYPQLNISINGGVKTLEECKTHLAQLDGVMVGREAYQNPYILAQVDQQLCGLNTPVLSRDQVLERLLPYIEAHLKQGGRLNHISRHIIGLFQGEVGSRIWRRHISENAHKQGAGIEVITQARAAMDNIVSL
ncbi:tRNA dihydrouridine(20/20a) synthase DusA [Shewanella fidelis]|uniref:tRNA-dihydrouridine(20/20a) synthase n=1 Tax=Shewanella fidelis TaxID=173509 RepID=A0AAW8NIK9_9GAMM|nr:tRNA dihydrouridine(20/20a) synthase DusA [Shewanella fidelis]MDR8522351.1 tRNA dihydrouridine(20/20a) synthase DusA [Shewanella fidelis]MDW4812433.1 tRNA dihydrouridine(20/20a) synthase DusA [Shewanella fidelis]MDW4816180.1 tRNA dihydrouridine(20/20a) synthase DusA [Shewanella fidelis]MDW4820674.1 tRNA dihydrouridine(20/20a) synthase DusA [Shewanella fidelis]MDW4824896.1 tRNA dihydrouridine(20/20a) synthase DusA [Shewanella fidelis]